MQQRDAVKQRGKLLQGRIEAEAARLHRFGYRQHGMDISRRQAVEQRIEVVIAHCAKHGTHALLLDTPGPMGDGLIEQ